MAAAVDKSIVDRAKEFYESDDSQLFYKNIWGIETIHIGRYDLLTDDELQSLTKVQQIGRAQELQEEGFLENIQSKFGGVKKLDVLDMGCGYGGLIRRLWEAGYINSATGVDIAAPMCDQARRLNEELGCDKVIAINEESYLNTSMKDNSVDLVISMEALLHVGPGPSGQERAVQEAFRVLRPGGWMVFTDILQKESVNREEMQPIYDRIQLSEMGTVATYFSAFQVAGFVNVSFTDHSSNVSAHYGSVSEVLLTTGDVIGLSQDYQRKMKAGLEVWRDLAPKNIEWGIIMAQKGS